MHQVSYPATRASFCVVIYGSNLMEIFRNLRKSSAVPQVSYPVPAASLCTVIHGSNLMEIFRNLWKSSAMPQVSYPEPAARSFGTVNLEPQSKSLEASALPTFFAICGSKAKIRLRKVKKFKFIKGKMAPSNYKTSKSTPKAFRAPALKLRTQVPKSRSPTPKPRSPALKPRSPAPKP